ncbi:ABC transporter permease [Paenibacillus sp. TRM 82003]|nr:ABC transporter permease [Paenibacillus sp. TRM 82003]
MLNLIRLELKKQKFRGAPIGFCISTLAITFMVSLLYFSGDLTEDTPIASYEGLLLIIDTFVRVTFLIYSSVLLAKFVVGEYKDKTITNLFTYPIGRKKLIAAKLVIVSVWTFVAILLANVIVSTLLLLMESQFRKFSTPLDWIVVADHIVPMLANAVAAVGIAQIPLVFGLWRKSVPATIVSAVVLTIFINSTNEDMNLSQVLAVPLSFGAVGFLLAYLAMRRIDKADVV